MTLPPGNEQKNRPRAITYALIALVGQVGCVTILIILGAVFAGLWLDKQFQTNNIITFVLVLASIPVSLLVMLLIVRSLLARIKPQLTAEKKDQEEEANVGGKNP